MMRGLVILFALSSSWSHAESRTIEVCRADSDLVREINRTGRDLVIETADRDRDSAERLALAALLQDHRAVVTVSDGSPLAAVLAGIADDGAVVSAGFKGTAPECVNVRTGFEVWSRLSSGELAAR